MTTTTKKTAKKSTTKANTVKMSAATKALMAKVEKAQKDNAAKLAEKVMVASLNATLALESSEVLFESKVKLAVSSQNTDKLQSLIDICSGIIDETPVQNSKTRTLREWAGSKRFAFGNQINLMYQLATGIMYSANEHKQLLLAHTQLDMELIEQLVEAFGSPAYYSRNHNALVDAKPYNIEAVDSAVAVMQSSLGVVVDVTKLTTANFSLEFGKGEIKALEDQAKASKAIAEMDTEL